MALASLPDDLLLELFRYLDTRQLLLARGVCRRWRDLAVHPHVWKHRSLVVTSALDDVLFDRAVLSLAPCLSNLTFRSLPLERKEATSETSPIGMAVRDVDRLSVSTSCAVRSLRLEIKLNCSMATRILENQTMMSSSRLRRLHLDMLCMDRTSMTLKLIQALRGAALLVELEVYFKQGNISWPPSAFIPSLSAKNDVPSLKKLVFSERDLGGSASDLLKFFLTTHALTLEVVEWQYSSHLPLDISVFSLLARCPNLVELHCPLSECIVELAQCQNLVKLYLRGKTRIIENADDLIQSCWKYFRGATRLRHLSFLELSVVALPLLQALSSSGQSALEMLALRSHAWNSDRYWDQFATLLSGMPQLRAIHIYDRISLCFLRSVSPLTAPRLRELHIRGNIPCSRSARRDYGREYMSEVRSAVFRNPGLHIMGLMLYERAGQMSLGDSNPTESEEARERWHCLQGLPYVPERTRFGVYSHAEGDRCDLHGSDQLWLRLE